jgi:hypothetical protein
VIAMRALNLLFLGATITCALGTMAGLVLFLPFAAGGWFLTLLAAAGTPETARQRSR